MGLTMVFRAPHNDEGVDDAMMLRTRRGARGGGLRCVPSMMTLVLPDHPQSMMLQVHRRGGFCCSCRCYCSLWFAVVRGGFRR